MGGEQMSSEKGLLQTCDRCGTTNFRKLIGKGEADGGWTTWDIFEDAPKGWGYHSETGLLCPACETEYQGMVRMFKKGAEADAG